MNAHDREIPCDRCGEQPKQFGSLCQDCWRSEVWGTFEAASPDFSRANWSTQSKPDVLDDFRQLTSKFYPASEQTIDVESKPIE